MKERRDSVRFNPPQEGESGYERIQALKEVIYEAIESEDEELPGLLGATVFGSMIEASRIDQKGKYTSDIDAWVFFDPDQVYQEFLGSDTSPWQNDQVEPLYEFSKEVEAFLAGALKSKIASKIQPILQYAVESFPDAPPEKVSNYVLDDITKHVMPTPMSKKIIEKIIALSADQYDPKASNPFKFINNLSILFFARMGKGIVPLRTHLLQELQKRGEQGNRMWEVISRSAYKWESREGASKKQYSIPSTLEEAVRLYIPQKQT